MQPQICVVIPVYNHAETLPGLVRKVLALTPHIIVVDDGSTDGCADRIKDLPLFFLRLPVNQGKGAAIMAGAKKARELGYSHIITMDADGQHLADDIPAFQYAIAQSPAALIIGARDFNVPNVPAGSRFGRKFSRFWMFIQTGANISDMQSGFRAYPLSILEAVTCLDKRYSFEIEIAVKAAWAGFPIREINIQVHYPPKAERISHFRPFMDNLRISLLNTRLTIRALTPLPFRRHILKADARLSLLRPLSSLRHLRAWASPSRLARSAAWSLLISAIPIIGLNTLALLFAIGWRKLDRHCALLMVPLTWPPVIPGIAVLLGHRIIHGKWLEQFNIQTLGYEAGYRLLDWIVGGIVLAPFLAAAGYGIVFAIAKSLKPGD